MEYAIEYYTPEKKEEWDRFIDKNGMNGTFLQSRHFLEYHGEEKFRDCSLMAYKGNALIAVVPACEFQESEGKVFFSHKGSSYGGIVICKNVYTATSMDRLFSSLEEFFQQEGFQKIYMKKTPDVYEKEDTALMDYFFYKYGYACYNELNYYMHLERYQDDIAKQFTSSKRRDFRYSLKEEMEFKELTTPEEIKDFYHVLQLNLRKLNLTAVHSYEDLLELKFQRFPEKILFYGVYKDDIMVAGSMIFLIQEDVFHTQYLSSDERYLKSYPMDFLIYHLIEQAVKKKMRLFTFGICTEDQGRYLNLGLSRFKEGFGTEYTVNRSYEKKF